jgi:DNA-binding HxlR family transcriptional regulator
MAEHEENRCVAVSDAVSLLGDKWMLMIYGVLGRRERIRYTELQRAVPGISQRILTLRLKTLAKNGLVKRTVFPTVPPRVDYELTDLGRGLLQPLRSLVHWMREHREELAEARGRQRGL